MSVNVEELSCYRVSSVLNRDVKSFGKKYLFDGNEDTCWNSEKGLPQWITLELKAEVNVSGFRIQFQGGFAGKKCILKCKSECGKESSEPFYPEDNNTAQEFKLSQSHLAKELTIFFEESTDFFGRIVVYLLQIFKT